MVTLPSWKKSLTARLALSFLALSLVTVGVVAVLAFVQARAALEQLVYSQLGVVSTMKEDELRRWVERQRDFTTFLAKAPELRSRIRMFTAAATPATTAALHAEMAAYLNSIIANQFDVRAIELLDDRDGKIIVATNSEDEGLNELDEPYFTQGRLGTYVQPAYLSHLDNQPTIAIAAPLTDESGKRRAVLAVHLNLNQLDTFIQNRTGLGATGQSYLVGTFNRYVSSARFGRQPLAPEAQTVGVRAALNGTSSTGLYSNDAGAPVIGVYRWLDDQQLALLIEIEQQEAFAPARRLALTIVLVGVGCSLLLTVGVLLLARRITRPVVELTRTAAQVAAGDLSQTAPVTTSDEIGTLAQAFNQMTGRLHVAYGKLQQREEHFRSLIEHASDVILIVGRDGLLTYDGPSITALLGYPHRGLRGASLAALVHPDDLPALLDAIGCCFGDAACMLEVEFRAAHTDGSWRILEGRGQYLRVERDNPGVVINARDITERVRAEEERARLQEENLRVRSEFISTVSHELRTPLTPIRGFVDLLLTELGGPINDDQRFYLATIRSNTVRMTSLVDDLLDLGKLQAGKIVLNYEWLQIETLLRQAVALFANEIERKEMQVHLAFDHDTPALYGDVKRLEQVTINLVSNAIKYTRAGGQVWVRASAPNAHCVEMQVQDTGVGMTPEQQQKLFTPFYRADNELRYEVGGTGLGLTIVKSFVELHGGTVTVQSTSGVGSTFTVLLPATGNFALANGAANGSAYVDNVALR